MRVPALPSEARVVAVLTVLLTLFALATVLAGGDPRDRLSFPRRSTYRAEPDGCKALFLTVQAMGHDAIRLREPWTRIPPETAVLFVISPPVAPEEEEWEKLFGWVREGGILIWAREQRQPLPSEIRWTDIPATGSGGIWEGASAIQVYHRALRLAPYPRLSQRMQWWEKAWPVYVQDGRQGALWTAWGQGAIVEVESPEVFSNEGLPRGGNLRFVLNAVSHGLSRGHGRRLVFDEYHHGYGYSAGKSTWNGLPSTVRTALWQALGAGLLLVWVLSRRLAAPRPLPPPPRQRSEYLESMAGLLERGKAIPLVVRTLRRQLADAVGRQWGDGSPVSDPAVQAWVAQRRGPLADEVRALQARLDVWERGAPAHPDEVLRAAHAVHRILGQMRRSE